MQTEYLWPCNLRHWLLWLELGTQWRSKSSDGGLDYAGVRAHLEVAHGLRGKSLRVAWAAVRACEEGALLAWREAEQRQRLQAERAAAAQR